MNSDICFDDLGIPYIPAKRVKGCLREGADTLINMGIDDFTDDLLKMFGDENNQGTLQFENLLIQGSSAIRAGLQAQQSGNAPIGTVGVGSWITAENVAACFTTLRSQTAINEDGYAKDNSLRVSRVLKRGLVFE
ncbi:hypothetical protein SDC9_190829 [bioreactor metagenome]|uniref:Uncharacterized protein n=1 Tax=bioreactor metagenome TaxID=1076179 RepID=A0A645HWN5_9ZZZZ